MQKQDKNKTSEQALKNIERENSLNLKHRIVEGIDVSPNNPFSGIYAGINDFAIFGTPTPNKASFAANLFTIEDLMARDKQREEDGFPRRIRLGKVAKSSGQNKKQVVIVPTTTEPKFYHDSSTTDEEESTGGSGEGEEGDVIGEQQAQPQQGEGEGQGAGQGGDGGHEVESQAYDLGKVLTERFKLPNIMDKGKKRSMTKYTYDLTDRNRGFGQSLDHIATLHKLVKTNILLGNISGESEVSPEDLLIVPQDSIYRILSPEKDFETQAVVFFVRDYSGSMQGKPTELIATQHLFIYSWLMYQYQNNVETRFILHDTAAKEVPDFYTYHNSSVAGGTNVFPAFELVNKIIEEEHLAKDYNIYVFYGTDGDDWDEDGKKCIDAIQKLLTYANRLGITISKNSWSVGSSTVVEKYIEKSNLLREKAKLIKMDSIDANSANEQRIVDGIKKLVE
jgi:uncharacterized sporulation protein YeaH/YhbH (DUF444 family)